MKPIFLLLPLILLSGMASAQYSSPPLDLLLGNNSAAASALDGYYNSSFAQNGSVIFRFDDYSQPAVISASVMLIGLSPEIDNVSCYIPDMDLVLARGHEEGHLTALPSEGYPDFFCDLDWYNNPGRQYDWRCDFDGDDCVEFENRTTVVYDANVTFSFRNASESVPLSSTSIGIPPSIALLLENASGAENLTINVSGNVTFTYLINDRTFDFGDCASNLTTVTGTLPINASATYRVGGSDKLVFLVRPILREQWFRDNRFDTAVLSQCPLYLAQIRLNNGSVSNTTIRTFNITTDEFGFMRMVSNLTNGSGWSENSSTLATPTPLEMGNNSFAYAYMFNYSYSGLGENNLSLIVTDSVLGQRQYNDTLLSRMLSYGGSNSENGQPMTNNSRPSASFTEGFLTRLELGLGLVGLVLILAFLNFWVAR
ncbi:MAG: hypothetical protein V1861_03530 [Candidatus Micrarchaeota archaeon]